MLMDFAFPTMEKKKKKKEKNNKEKQVLGL